MSKDIKVQRSTVADIPKILDLIKSTSNWKTSASELEALVRDGKSVIAKTVIGDIVGHNAIFETKEGELINYLTATRPGYSMTLKLLIEELKGLQRKDKVLPESGVLPGSCDK